MDKRLTTHLLQLRERIVSNFTANDWEEIGLLTGQAAVIEGHPRLLRSLHWGDADYNGNVLCVLRQMADGDPEAVVQIELFLEHKYPDQSHFISAKPSVEKITFAPHVFQIPDLLYETDLIALMMPFRPEFSGVYEAVKTACHSAQYRCLRADDLWEESTIIQDIFNLLVRSQIVVVDFTGRNPNVMYETGIAHTLGRLVVPISQSLKDVPFDMAHHRILTYVPTADGFESLISRLATKLTQLRESI
jgi:hypothetical protein